MAIHANAIYVWGSGGTGQLGLGSSEDHARPQRLVVPAEIDPKTITTGGCHSAALSSAGHLYVWGDNAKRQLLRSPEEAMRTAPTRVVLPSHSDKVRVLRVGCGWTHTVVVEGIDREEEDGAVAQRVRTWGANDHHQLGRPSTAAEDDLFVPLGAQHLRPHRSVTSIACGWKHSILALDDGTLFTWGSGRHGELGLGSSRLTAVVPTGVPRLVDSPTAQFRVYCGWQHTIVHDGTSGRVFAFGNNRHGQLGVPSSAEKARFEPRAVYWRDGEALNVREVDVGWHFALCVDTRNSLIAWGKGAHGQLGTGEFRGAETPTAVAFEPAVREIACGSEHSLVVTEDGDLYTCGWGEHGNLGHGDNENRARLTRVEFFTDESERVVHVRAGGAVSIAITESDPRG